MITLLAIVVRQYRLVLHKDPGFRYENLVFVRFPGLDPAQADMLKHQAREAPRPCRLCVSRRVCPDMNVRETTSRKRPPAGACIFSPTASTPTLSRQWRSGWHRAVISAPTRPAMKSLSTKSWSKKCNGPDSPIGKTVLLFQTPRTIVGVVENFYNRPLIRGPNSVIHPSVLMPATGARS